MTLYLPFGHKEYSRWGDRHHCEISSKRDFLVCREICLWFPWSRPWLAASLHSLWFYSDMIIIYHFYVPSEFACGQTKVMPILVGRLSILGQRKSCGPRARPRKRDEEAETTARSRGYSFLNSQLKINTYNSPPSRSTFYSEIAP